MYSFNLKDLPFQLCLAGRLHTEESVNRDSGGSTCKKDALRTSS